MVASGPKAEMQFKYWDLKRRGMIQSEIARKYDISRQAVNKSIKLHERDVMYRLLETAQANGALVEWFDASRGVLIGITPQLGNLPSIMILDYNNRVRMFFDQSGNPERDLAISTMKDLKETVLTSLGIDAREEASFRGIIKKVYEG